MKKNKLFIFLIIFSALTIETKATPMDNIKKLKHEICQITTRAEQMKDFEKYPILKHCNYVSQLTPFDDETSTEDINFWNNKINDCLPILQAYLLSKKTT